jgi:hypothetical protein
MRRSSLNLIMVWRNNAPFTLKKGNFSVSIHYLPKQWYIFISNLTYGYVIKIHRSSSNFVMVWW